MLVDYSDLEKEINEVPEPKVLPKGSEVKARIIDVADGVSDKNDCQWYMPVFDVPSEPLALEFRDFFWDLIEAKSKVEEKQRLRTYRKFKLFVEAFDIDLSQPFSWDELIGKEGWVILGIQKDPEYGEKNTIQKYVTGH